MAIEVKVPLKERSYPITIGRGVIRQLPKRLPALLPSRHIVVITNTHLARLHGKLLKKILKPKFRVDWIVIPDGEKQKNLKTVSRIHEKMLRLGAARTTGIVAFGGGVVGDIAGFVAATYMRGIPYVQVPTTLLAQVDSSVGGKTAVDLPRGKNSVGAFYQPRWVVIDTDFLKTLPKRELRCGLAEIVKAGLLGDLGLFVFLEKNVGKILSLNHNALIHLIRNSCRIKAKIVGMDERESSLRSLLNLGHTLGHAIEVINGYRTIRHGEAVAMGLVYAALLSSKREGFPSGEVYRIKRLLFRIGLPTRWPRHPVAIYRRAVSVDKKGEAGAIRFVVLKKIGRAALAPMTVKEALRYVKKN